MNDEQLKAIILSKLTEVAPDVDPEALDPQAEFRDQFDFDSMDCLNFAIALHEALGIDIPERDYPKITSLEGCMDYLKARLPSASAIG